MKWVTINFKQIDEDAIHLYERADHLVHDKGFMATMERMLLRVAPLITGFAAGFKLAWGAQ